MQIIFLKIRLNNNLNKQSLELFSYLHSLQKKLPRKTYISNSYNSLNSFRCAGYVYVILFNGRTL